MQLKNYTCVVTMRSLPETDLSSEGPNTTDLAVNVLYGMVLMSYIFVVKIIFSNVPYILCIRTSVQSLDSFLIFISVYSMIHMHLPWREHYG